MAQPTTQALLDPANPFYGHMFYAQGAGLWDARNGAMLTKTGPGGVVSEGGANLVESAGPTGGTTYTLAAPLVTVGAMTVIVKGRAADVGVISGAFFGANDNANSSFRFGGAVKKITVSFPKTAGGAFGYNIPLTGNNYDLATYAFTITPEGLVNFYINGAFYLSFSSGESISLRITEIMDGYGGTSQKLKGVLEYLMIIPAVCTPEQVASLTAEPYQSLVGFISTVTAPAATLVGDGLLYASGADNGSVTVLVAANEINVSLPTGSETNYPYQFGRPFRKGEIVDSPQVLLDGVPLTTQADIKTRHRDGSVKFAVISVVLPTISTTNRVITFQNQAAPVVTPVSIASMLVDYDFEASIDIKSGAVSLAGAPVSARAMLATLTDAGLDIEASSNGVNSRYWTAGNVCTSIILCDHTTKTWDVGTNAWKAIRPIFHVQFWPGINRYHVRHIVEVADVTKLKTELDLNIIFSTGNTASVERLNQAACNLWFGSWQSRAYWGGVELPRINAKHGIAYLAETGVMPNFNPSLVMNAGALDAYGALYDETSKALGTVGLWQRGMNATGGRQDLGIMPKWDVVAMYSGDAKMNAFAELHAEFAGSWNMFLREGLGAKVFYGSTSGLGRTISKVSRPTLMFPQMALRDNGATGDKLSFDYSGAPYGTTASNDYWAPDDAHTPGAFWLQYITTGAYFWQEKLTQMAAQSQFCVNPGIGFSHSANGNRNTDCILNGQQSRATGWQFRNRGRAWWMALDGSPEKRLFTKWLDDASAMWCGVQGLPAYIGNPIREDWNTNHIAYFDANPGFNPRPNALGFFHYPSEDAIANANYNTWPDDSNGAGTAQWMNNYVSLSLQHIVELGYTDVKPLADMTSRPAVQMALSGEPWHVGDYNFPDRKNDNTYYQSVADIFDGWPGRNDRREGTAIYMSANPALGYAAGGAPTGPLSYNVSVDTYAAIATMAIAMASGDTDASAAYEVIRPWAEATNPYYSYDPRYAVLPRVATTATVQAVTANGATIIGSGVIYTGVASVVGGVKTVSVSLVDASNAPLASMTGIKWAWFDQATPDTFNAPTDKGIGEVTDGSGVLTVSIPNSTKASGQTGWLVITDSDGTVVMAHKAFSGPVAIN